MLRLRISLPLALVAWPMSESPGRLGAQGIPACDPLATLIETVRDRTTDAPLAGASITARWGSGRDESVQASTDSSGTARICAPADRVVTLRVAYQQVRGGPQTTRLAAGGAVRHTFLIDVPGTFLRGVVIDDGTGNPIENVALAIANTRLSAVSRPDGTFHFDRIPMGDHVLRASHISYTAMSSALRVSSSDLDVAVRLAPSAIVLEPIVVATFSRRLDRVGFYEREKRGIGSFISRSQIDAMKAHSSSDLLRNVPSTRLIPQWPRRAPQRNELQGRGRCRYAFIVDGARTMPDFEMEYLAPYAIEGIEVYRGIAEVPAAFRAHVARDALNASCGVIAIWTRDSH